MKISIIATTIGDRSFLEPLWESHVRNTHLLMEGHEITFQLMLDSGAPIDPAAVYTFAKNKCEVINPEFGYDKNLHWLWYEAVARSFHADIAVVLNDDVWLSPGWLYAITDVLSKNADVGIVGIPCDDSSFKAIPFCRARWQAGDRSIFYADDFERFYSTPAKYEHHTAGFCWATRPRIWLQAGCVKIRQYGWAYGEAVMSRQLHKLGYQAASIYYPLCYHYGGGSFAPEINQRNGELAKNDSPLFYESYGTIHMHELQQKWDEENGSMKETIVYDPAPVRPLIQAVMENADATGNPDMVFARSSAQ